MTTTIQRLRLHFVCGLTTGIQFDVPRTPGAFRRQQAETASALGEEIAGWEVRVPESYADLRTSSRSGLDVQPRVWDKDSVGTTRLPVGFLRFTKDAAVDARAGAVADVEAQLELLVWADGTAVIVASVKPDLPGAISPEQAQQWIDATTFGHLDEALRSHAQALLDAVERRLSGPEHGGPAVSGPIGDVEVRYVGRHRLVHIDAEPCAASVDDIGRAMYSDALDQNLVDISSDERRYAAPANGISIEIAPGQQSMLLPVARYYQRWIAAITKADDELYDEIVRLSTASQAFGEDSHTQGHARQLFYEHRDVLNAQTPVHTTAWNTYVSTWRVAELQADVEEKVAVVDELNRSLRENVANRIAARTGAVVTFLTALTLVSIVTGIAAFVLSEERLSTLTRWSLVGASLFLALTLFAVSIQPLLVRRVGRGRTGAVADR
ncbi:hypothetical protein NHL50_14295 [Acidimicrobiia bacterium EGI L10123]|uniref:hypothetical protein n=1 Tax=Salinilacustrithrix flava TaxID=2957203 RepID=UPI003D7C2341|nr:hypothetical protein [Acidimicrobiia bacterium EGI L10123]